MHRPKGCSSMSSEDHSRRSAKVQEAHLTAGTVPAGLLEKEHSPS